jgi:hypothetical protein
MRHYLHYKDVMKVSIEFFLVMLFLCFSSPMQHLKRKSLVIWIIPGSMLALKYSPFHHRI